MTVIDASYLQALKSAFKFSEKRSFCQISTVDKSEGQCLPKARTMLLALLEERGEFYFTCSTQTHKWGELLATPVVTGVYLDPQTHTQYRFEAEATLIDKNSEHEKTLYESTWATLHPELRSVLWQEFLGDEAASYDVDEVFPCHGVVVLKPYAWDIFTLSVSGFAQSQRTQMVLRDNRWEVHKNTPRICPLDL